MLFDNKDMVWFQTTKKSQKQLYVLPLSLISIIILLKVMLISGLVVTYRFVAFAQGGGVKAEHF